MCYINSFENKICIFYKRFNKHFIFNSQLQSVILKQTNLRRDKKLANLLCGIKIKKWPGCEIFPIFPYFPFNDLYKTPPTHSCPTPSEGVACVQLGVSIVNTP